MLIQIQIQIQMSSTVSWLIDGASLRETVGAEAATKMLMKRGSAENGTPLAARPTVGAKCHGGVNDISIYDGKVVGQGGDGVPAGFGTRTARTRDVPMFGALVVR